MGEAHLLLTVRAGSIHSTLSHFSPVPARNACLVLSVACSQSQRALTSQPSSSRRKFAGASPVAHNYTMDRRREQPLSSPCPGDCGNGGHVHQLKCLRPRGRFWKICALPHSHKIKQLLKRTLGKNTSRYHLKF